MKKLFVFFIILLLIDSSHAQTPICDYKVFPIGAICNEDHDSLETLLGMNFSWYGWNQAGPLPQIPYQSRVNDTSVSRRDPFYFDTTVNHTTTVLYDSILLEAGLAKDVRVFLPGTSGVTGEYNFGWQNQTGHLISTADPEWQIRGDTAAVGYVLSNFSGDAENHNNASIEPYTQSNSQHRGSFSYEWVYFFNATQLSHIATDTTSLYSIEYWIKKSTDTAYSFYLADNITRNSYNALPFASTQVSGRKVGAEQLDNWTGVASNVHYKIQKHILRIDTFFVGDTPPQVDVRLNNFKKIPIFVRLLRIRDWRAQRLLTGKADSLLNLVLNVLKLRSGNLPLKAWDVDNEPFYPTFHSLAYLNDLFAKDKVPPLTVLAPHNYDEFVRVEHDQTENPIGGAKPFIWHEWNIAIGPAWRSFNTGTPPTWYWDESINAFPPRPLPEIFTTDSAEWYNRGVYTDSSYVNFTNQWQNNIIGFPSEASGGGAGFMNGVLANSKACYELDPAHPVPYYGCFQAGASPSHSVPLWSVESQKIAAGKTDPKYNAWGDSVYSAQIIAPYLSRHPGQVLVEDSLYKLFWGWRAPTEAEIRLQLWLGIAGGLKGYNVNMALEDQGYNDGIIWDSASTNHIIKSNQRTEMRFYGNIHLPYSGSNYNSTIYLRTSKILPAFKGMFGAVHDAIFNELGSIAPTLTRLNWRGLLSWHKRDSTPTYLGRLPLKNLHTKTITGSIDSNNVTFVDCGIYKDPNDSIATFVSLVNRRIWTDVNDTLSRDSRKISFQVDTSKFPSGYAQMGLWRISDVSGKLQDAVIRNIDTFSFTVKPGQGKLFRVAPAVGLTLGEMSTNVYNNSRHVSPIEFNKDSVLGYVATYEKNGQIFISYPTETPTGISKRTTGTPADTLVASDPNYVLHTPAVAYDSASHTVGIVYCGIKTGAHNDIAKIFFKSANYLSNKYNFSTAFMLNLDTAFIVPQGYTPAPSIMPTNRSDTQSFWIGWTDTAHGGNIVIERPTGGFPSARASFNFDLPIHAGFVSLAARKNFPNSVQIAYQESDQPIPSIGWLSHIFYLSATYNGSAITTTPPLNISAPFGICLNFHPQISLTKSGVVDVAWEIKQGSFARGDRQSELLTHICVFKTRNIAGQWAKSLTAFTFDRDTLPVISQDPIVLYPNILHSDDVDGSLTSWSTFYRLMWNDAKTNSAAMAINGRTDTIGGAIVSRGWEEYTMAEPSLEPSLPHLALGDRIAQPVLYRTPTVGADGVNYDARITQYDFPKTTLVSAAITKKTLSLPPPGQLTPPCKPPFGGALTTPYLHHDTSTTLIAFIQSANSGVDSTVVDSIGWDDYAHVKTAQFTINPSDTIRYGRYFRTGYNYGDTTYAADSLKGSTDYLKLRILLRSVPSNTIVAVLDSAVLKESGLTQSADTSNAGIKSYVVPGGLVGTVYMTFEASRGNSTNGYSISQMEYYNDSIAIDIPPSSDTVMSYKKADPSPTSQLVTVPDQIKVSVVPNPFTSSTRITIDVPKDIPLNVTVFDALGRQVTRLFDGISDNEFYQFTFGDQSTSTGVFYVRVQAGGNIVTRKIQLVK